jgi:gliding motility-associated protein GldM
MINLMYLVLMALLALNVSAEVMNAFFSINKSLEDSNKLQQQSAKDTQEGIQEILKKKPKLMAPLNSAIDEVQGISDDFSNYVEAIKDTLIDVTGNRDGKNDEGDYDEHGKPKGKKKKDDTTRIMVKEGKGDELEKKILDARARFIAAYERIMNNKSADEIANLTQSERNNRIEKIKNTITLNVTDEWKSSDKNSWSEYKFKQMPLAAVLPTLTKMQADARNAEANIVNDLAGLVGGREIKFDKFFPVMNAKKGYVIKGETFDAEVSLGAYSSEVKGVSISVNGQNISLNSSGVGKFSETASSTGKRTLNLVANVVNPLTGKAERGTATYEYEVGVRSVTVSADKMNVFYIGVPNPVSVAVAGASSNEIRVSGSGCSITGSGGKYTVTASSPGEATLTVSGGGLPATPFKFRVKRIPDPVPCFRPNGDSGGTMGNGEFKAMQGVVADLRNFDFEARCDIMGFELTKQAARQDPVTAPNSGARYSGRAANLVESAKPGDVYYFDNIKARCPGDGAGRKLPDMVWKIK